MDRLVFYIGGNIWRIVARPVVIRRVGDQEAHGGIASVTIWQASMFEWQSIRDWVPHAAALAEAARLMEVQSRSMTRRGLALGNRAPAKRAG